MNLASSLSFIVSGTLLLQRPEKYLGDLGTWEKAETSLTEALNEFGNDWQVKDQIHEAGYYVDFDMNDNELSKKLSVRGRDDKKVSVLAIEELLEQFMKEDKLQEASISAGAVAGIQRKFEVQLELQKQETVRIEAERDGKY